MNKKNLSQSIFFFVIILSFFSSTSSAEMQKKVAVLGIDTTSAGRHAYIGPAATEIIKSRIAKSGKITLASAESKKNLSQDELKTLKKAGIDYVISGKIVAGETDMGISLFLIHTGSADTVAMSNSSPIKPDQALPAIESFIEKARGEIIKGAQAGRDEAPQLAPTLLTPVQEEDIAHSRVHPDRLLRTAKGRSAYPDTGQPMKGQTQGSASPSLTLPEETGPRPTLVPAIQKEEKQGLFAKIFRIKASKPDSYPVPSSSEAPLPPSVYDLPSPEHRPVLLSPISDQAQHKSFWAYLWPWGEDEKKYPQAGYYAGQLPYPSPEELEAISMPDEKRPGLATSPDKSTRIYPAETPQEERRRGWLGWMKWPWSNEEEKQEKPAETKQPPSSKPSEGGPVWQWR